MKVVLTAATRWEAKPLIRLCAENDVTLVVTGIGAHKAKAALEKLDVKPSLVISSGFAGALQEGMRSGDLVADPHGAPLDLVEAIRNAAQGVAPIHMGRMVSVSQVLANPEEKRALGESRRAVAVDMESAAIRQWAAEKGADFAALRVVLDTVDQRLPSGVPNGESAGALLRYVLKNAEELPLMLRVFLAQGRAMRKLRVFLGNFLKESRAVMRV